MSPEEDQAANNNDTEAGMTRTMATLEITAQNKKLSWSDFNSLLEQSRSSQNALLERIESLEKSRASEEQSPLIEQQQQQQQRDQQDPSCYNGSKESLSGSGTPTKDIEIPHHEEENEGNYVLPESTYTLLIVSQSIFSAPFALALVAATLSLFCLILTLVNELDNGSEGNAFGLPAGVNPEVRMAQFVGAIIGVLLEEEVPIGLELIARGLELESSLSTKYGLSRIIFSSVLRLAVGYMFLISLIITVLQEDDVISIFFDVLALQFVESIDDVVYQLAMKGFFGMGLLEACSCKHIIKTRHNNAPYGITATYRRVRLVYWVNVIALLSTVAIFTRKQYVGDYRCQSYSISFADDIWEDAYIKLENGTLVEQVLIYSHFNGIYKENGTHDGYPKYTEQNKEDGSPFHNTVGAEIIYCVDLEAWVFTHKNIMTSRRKEQENECSWLLISPQTEDYDLTSVTSSPWSVWTGQITPGTMLDVACNECDQRSDCNYHGQCVNSLCECDDDHFGIHCQLERPCKVIFPLTDFDATLSIVPDPSDEEVDFVEVYGRPVYVIKYLEGKPMSFLRVDYLEDDDKYYKVARNITDEAHSHLHNDLFLDDDFFYFNNQSAHFQEIMKNYTFLLTYTGRRWYGAMMPFDFVLSAFDEVNYHAFWMGAFSGFSTFIISAPTSGSSPVGVDFFELRRRNDFYASGVYSFDYGPTGVLIPLVNREGAGFFHCKTNSSAV